MLTREQRAEFRERGFLRLREVFSHAEAASMEERLWMSLARRFGVHPDDPGSWVVPLGTGLRSVRTHAVFRPNDGPVLHEALDDLIGKGRWEVPKHWGQFLVNFPASERAIARSRSLWHTDFPYSMSAERVDGALVFTFVGDVPPRAGGTLVMAGSPARVARFVGEHPRVRKERMKVARRALLASDPWLASLGALAGPGWPEKAVGARHCGRGESLEVVELSGKPGEVVIGHPWLLHTPSPNRGDRPRFMRVQRVRAAVQPSRAR